MSKNNSSDNLLVKPSNSLSKYYENYNADKAKASSRGTVIEPPTDEEDIERQMSCEDVFVIIIIIIIITIIIILFQVPQSFSPYYQHNNCCYNYSHYHHY